MIRLPLQRCGTGFFCAIMIPLLLGSSTVFGEEKKNSAPIKLPRIHWQFGDDAYLGIENFLRMDGIYGHLTRMLNPAFVDYDRTVAPGRYVFDSKVTGTLLGCKQTPLTTLTAGVRFRGVFGDTEGTFKTGNATIKDLEAIVGPHKHPINVNILILRELWIEFSNELFQMPFENRHTFTMGVFPFKLGRGISLGEAYGVVPDFLGYDPVVSVEQFAPGFKFSGDWVAHKIGYDAYVEIIANRSATFAQVNEYVRGQQYGFRFDQSRRFGAINWLLAGRLRWTPLDAACKKLYVEPYALFNDERDQRIEFAGDAKSKIGTFGFALESTLGNFEFGMDTAFNVGHQCVFGVDRNIVKKEIRGAGVPTFVYSQVNFVNPPAPTALATYSSDNQKIIDQNIKDASPCSKLEPLNGQFIIDSNGNVTQFQNSEFRYRDAYSSKYGGSMLVADAWYTIPSCKTKLAATFGFATGDENPHQILNLAEKSVRGGAYKGFVSFQELYSGKRVRSAFMLGGKGAIPRSLSFPADQAVLEGYPSFVTRFNNLVFGGVAAWWEGSTTHSNWKINPNLLFYSQQRPSRLFDWKTDKFTSHLARTFLGTELNLFWEVLVSKNVNLWGVVCCFVPGTHYDDVQGRPLSRAEREYLDQRDPTGVPLGANKVPILGNNTAWVINAGFDFRF